MQYPKIVISLLSLILYLPLSHAEKIYVSVQGMNAGSSLLLIDEQLDIQQQIDYPLGHIISLSASTADNHYIYGIATDGVFAFDARKQEFIYRNSNAKGITVRDLFLAKPQQETGEEWLHVVNFGAEMPDNRSSDTLIALERSYFAGDAAAKSAVFNFEEDYNWSHRIIEFIIADPKDHQHFYLILSGNEPENRERHIVEMRFNSSEKRYELIKSIPLNHPEKNNRVKKGIMHPKGDWVYLTLDNVSEIIMFNTKDFSQHILSVGTNLEDFALNEDGKKLLATYHSPTNGGLKSFVNITNPEKIELHEDSPTSQYSYAGQEYSYNHERILANPINNYVPEYFALTTPISVGTHYYPEEFGKISTIKINETIKRGEAAALISEQDSRLQTCISLEFYCFQGDLAYAYADKNTFYSAKAFTSVQIERSILLSKVDLKNPNNPITYVFHDEGQGRFKYPTSILILD